MTCGVKTLVLMITVGQVVSQRSGPILTTRQGSLQGQEEIISGRRVYSFRGIKYAEVAARFTYSRPYHDSWSGTRSARTPGPACPQPFYTGEYSEDCLHLSVWSPVLPGYAGRPLPVLVYLTGSLFTVDTQGRSGLAPESLVAERNIIVVSVSSRLNVFGFLSLENVVVPGNMGLLDQYLALLWLRDNLRFLGGDETKITLAGSGSGAASALYLALSARSASLVRGVMAVSGTPLAPWASSRAPAENARRFLNFVDCYGQNSRAVLACLQTKTVRQIVTALEDHLAAGNITHIFAPVLDNFLDREDRFIGDSIQKLREGRVDRRISFVLGENEEDGSEMMFFLRRNFDRLNVRDIKYFIDNTLVPVSLLRYPPLLSSPFVQQLLSYQYFHTPGRGLSTLEDRVGQLEAVQRFLTHCYYSTPMRETASGLSGSGGPVYSWVNTHRVSQPLRNYLNRSSAGAGAEIPLLLGPRQFSLSTGRQMSRLDREVSIRFQDVLIPLFEQGTPPLSFQWPRYTQQSQDFLQINSLETSRQFREKETKFWLELLPSLALISQAEVSTVSPVPVAETDVYSTLTWLLLATVLLLLVLLAVSWVTARRRARTESVFTLGSRLGDSSCLESRAPRSRWRETLTSHRM